MTLSENTSDFRRVRRAAIDQGWAVSKTKNTHWKFLSPEGSIAFFSGSPSDHRAFKNFVAEMRRKGLRWRNR